MSKERYAGMPRPRWVWAIAPIECLAAIAYIVNDRLIMGLALAGFAALQTILCVVWERKARESRAWWKAHYEAMDALQQQRRIDVFLAHPPPIEPWRN